MTITIEQFKRMFPSNPTPAEWVDALNAVLPHYQINLADFLSQCGHESQGFTAVVENLNYSAAALLATWPKRFAGVAEQYARKPEAIGNRAYANRMGNGKDNHKAFARSIGKTLDETLEYLKTKQGAVESACWFWKDRGLGRHEGNVTALTKVINGGLNGLADRQARYERATGILA